MSLTVDQLRVAINREYPTRDWVNQCQRFVWNAIWLTTGVEPTGAGTYGSAETARLASTIAPRRVGESLIDYIKRAPLGSIQYWEYGTDGHDGVTVGPNLVAYATANGDTVQEWGTRLKVSHTTSYPLGTYKGWALRNGINPAIKLTGAITAGTGATPIQGDDDMAHMELIQGEDGTVWFCVDRITRYAIPAQRNLDTYKAFLTDLKKSSAIVQKSNADLPAYGTPVYADPLNRYAVGRDITAAQAAILAAIAAIPPSGNVTVNNPDLTAPLAKLTEALTELATALK